MIKRGRGKISGCLTIKQAWKEYIREYPEGDAFHVDYNTYRLVCSANNKASMNLILDEAEVYKIYANLGNLRIEKKKMNLSNLENKLKIDYKRTRELGIRVYHLNEHSNGYRFAFKWEKANCRIKNKKAYSLIINRTDKRRLAANIKDGKDYFN